MTSASRLMIEDYPWQLTGVGVATAFLFLNNNNKKKTNTKRKTLESVLPVNNRWWRGWHFLYVCMCVCVCFLSPVDYDLHYSRSKILDKIFSLRLFSDCIIIIIIKNNNDITTSAAAATIIIILIIIIIHNKNTTWTTTNHYLNVMITSKAVDLITHNWSETAENVFSDLCI